MCPFVCLFVRLLVFGVSSLLVCFFPSLCWMVGCVCLFACFVVCVSVFCFLGVCLFSVCASLFVCLLVLGVFA